MKTPHEQEHEQLLSLHEFLKNTHDGYRVIDTKGFIVMANGVYGNLVGYTRDELLKMNIRDIDFPDNPSEVEKRIEEVIKKGSKLTEMRQRRKDGSFFDSEVSSTFLNFSGGILVSLCRDISQRKERETERSIMLEFLRLNDQPECRRQFMAEAALMLQKWSGCEAVGIRLKDGDDYPYYETVGFPPEFVEGENRLCARDESGLPVKDANDRRALECICGNVIHGHFDPSLPFFTTGGSFWTNSVTALQASTNEEQPGSRLQGCRHAAGYESVALIPLKWGDANLGLLQFNDRRPGRFSASTIAILENATAAMAAGLVSRRSAKELREKDEKYRLIVEASLEGILISDLEFRLVYVNNAMAEMLGYNPDELIGRNVRDFFCDSTTDKPDMHLQRRRAGQDEIHEHCLRHKDGRPVWTIVSARAMKNAAGGFAGSFAMITDITSRKQLEEDLRKSEAQYRSLVEAIPDVLTRLDRQRRFVSVSSNIAGYTGIPHTSLIGKTHQETDFPAELSDFALEIINNVFSTGLPMETEFVFDGLQGKTVFNWRVIPELDAEGRVGSVITLARDITRHRQAELEYKTLFNAMLDGFALHEIILDDKGSPVDYRFLAVNPAFERITGLKAEDVIGRRVREILPDTEPHWIEAYGRVALTGEPAVFQMHHKGLGKDFEISAYRPAPMQCANIFIDVTEIRRAAVERESLQKQYFHAQKMESVGLLAGGVAHDFNNKLSVILGNAEMALETIGNPHPARDHLNEIIKASSLSAELTRQLLAFARKQEISPRALYLNKTLSNIFKMLDRLIGENIKLIYDADENLWPVKMDPAQLDQIMANLCINARDAIRGKGSVSVTTSNVSLDAEHCRKYNGLKPGDYVRLTVSDTGIGMSEEVKEHLFEPFFTTKGEGKGSGLGLATVYGAVKQNNGNIYAESRLGEGTVFTIYLPRHTGRADVEAASRDSSASGGTETILVVEDEQSILDILRLLLTRLGYQVLAAVSPAEAFKIAARQNQRIDLLITDVAMSGMSGFELARDLKAVRPEIKVVYISGHSPDGIARYGQLDKEAVFIQKPFTRETLAGKVHQALKKDGN